MVRRIPEKNRIGVSDVSKQIRFLMFMRAASLPTNPESILVHAHARTCDFGYVRQKKLHVSNS